MLGLKTKSKFYFFRGMGEVVSHHMCGGRRELTLPVHSVSSEGGV